MDPMRHRIYSLPIASLGLFLLMSGRAEGATLLGALPDPGGYVSATRVILIFAAAIPWLAFCQWVNTDTDFVRRMKKEIWNNVVFWGGLAGLLSWMILPWNTTGLFAAGFGLWFVITVGVCSIYVVMRNGLVDPGARVFTPRHIKGVFGNMGKKKEQKLDAVERVKLNAHDGTKITVPSDPNKMEAYEDAQSLLFDALWRRATEVELMVGNEAARLAYRIDGVVTPRNDLLDHESADRALTFLKRVAGLDIEERRKPQNGALSGAINRTDAGMTEVEVRSSGTTQHERLSLRITGEETRLRINDLGMKESMQERFSEICKLPGGLVLASGPKASGVTSTLYACLRTHDAFMQNLLTIEREPLMELENITQHIYDATKHEASYARQFQTVLRREPDVVMVSDCQDRETAHLAAKSAEDQKKIYMGIQARDCFDALKKLVSLAGDTEAVANVLQVITSQRLVRKLCIACRQAYKPDTQLLKKANLPIDKIDHFYRPPPDGLVDQKGNPIICSNCQGSGYFGRTGVFEMLEVDDSVRELIRKGQPVNTIKAQCRKNGMLYLEEVALQKVITGVTSMNEILRVLREEEAVGRPRR